MKNYTLKIALVALGLFVSFSSFAQLNITQSVQTKPEKLLVVRMSYAWLYKTSEGYSLCMNTSNQFDKHYTTINLGTNAEGVIATCKDLLSLVDNQVAAVSVTQGSGDLIITLQSMLGSPYLDIKQDNLAGHSNVTPAEIKKIMKYFGYDESKDVPNEEVIPQEKENADNNQ